MNRRIFGISKVVLAVFMVALSLFPSACEPGGDITIQNLQSQNVTIFYSAVLDDGTLDILVKQGDNAPNESKPFGAVFLGSDFIKIVVAKDPLGKIVFRHDYKMADLVKIGWKITIPP